MKAIRISLIKVKQQPPSPGFYVFVFVLFVCFIFEQEWLKNIPSFQKHPSLLVHKINLTNIFPLIKLKETWLLVFYNKKNWFVVQQIPKFIKKIANPLAIHFISWKSLTDGKILKTCALRPAGIYGEGEFRHLPRIVISLIQILFYFSWLQNIITDTFLQTKALSGP